MRRGARGRTRGKLVLALQTAAQGQALSEGNERAREDRRIFKPVPALAMSRCATRPVPEPRTPHTCWACPHAKEFSLREHGGRWSAASTVLLPASALASAVAPMSPMRGPISNGMQTVCNLLCSAKGHVVGAQAFANNNNFRVGSGHWKGVNFRQLRIQPGPESVRPGGARSQESRRCRDRRCAVARAPIKSSVNKLAEEYLGIMSLLSKKRCSARRALRTTGPRT